MRVIRETSRRGMQAGLLLLLVARVVGAQTAISDPTITWSHLSVTVSNVTEWESNPSAGKFSAKQASPGPVHLHISLTGEPGRSPSSDFSYRVSVYTERAAPEYLLHLYNEKIPSAGGTREFDVDWDPEKTQWGIDRLIVYVWIFGSNPQHYWQQIDGEIRVLSVKGPPGQERPAEPEAARTEEPTRSADPEPTNLPRATPPSGSNEPTAEAPAPEPTPMDGGDWMIIIGGVGALSAAALALITAFRRRWKEHAPDGNEDDIPPDTIVGYVLQLSADRFTLAAGESASLVVTVWSVNVQGATSVASSAEISVTGPAGLSVSPDTGSGRVVAQLTATDELARGSYAVSVNAQAGGGGYSASVSVTVGARYDYALSLTPSTVNLSASERCAVRARVAVQGPDADHCTRETQRLAPAITAMLSGNAASCFTVQEAVEGDSKTAYLTFTMPDDLASRVGPQTATYTVRVMTPNGALERRCELTISSATGFELAMPERLSLRANDVASSLRASLHSRDPNADNAETVIALATPNITFAVSGPQAHWLREENGAPGKLSGDLSGGATPAMEAHPCAEVPMADIAERGPFSATVTASVAVPRHGTITQTATIDITPPEWFIEVVAVKQDVLLDGKDSAEFRVRLLPQQQHLLRLYGGETRNQLNPMLRVRAIGPNASSAVLTETAGVAGYRTFQVKYTATGAAAPAEFVDLEATAELTGVTLTQPLRINLIGKPTLKVSVDSLFLKAEGTAVTVTGEVLNPGAEQWKVYAVLKDIDAVTKNDPPPAKKIAVVITPGALDASTQRATGTLVFTASTATEDLEPVSVPITVQDEGLVLLTNPVTVLPDPKATKPAIVKLQVLRWSDELKRLKVDRAAMEKGITWGSFTAATYERGELVFQKSGVSAEFQWFNGSGMEEYAVYKVHPAVPVPCDATAIDAKWSVSAAASGWEADKFERELTVQFPDDPTKVMEPRLAKEIANCKKIILFLPDGHRLKWEEKILAKDAPLLGYHGLYRMRHQIWEEAREALLREAQAYLADATYNNRVVIALDWAKWVLDLAFQTIESVVVPFPGNLALDQVRAFATEYCAAACNEGTPVDKFAIQYFSKLYEDAGHLIADMALGLVLNLDVIHEALEKRYPSDPIKVAMATCEIFWVGTFIQFLSIKKNPQTGDAYSISESFIEATRTLRDQILVSIFSKKLRAKYPQGGAHGQPGEPSEPSAKRTVEEPSQPKTKVVEESTSAPQVKEKVAPTDTSKAKPTEHAATEPRPESRAEPRADRVKEPAPTIEERTGAWNDGMAEGRTIIDQAHEAAGSGNKQHMRDAALDLQANKPGIYQINRDDTPQTRVTRMAVKEELKEVYHDADAGTCAELADKFPPRPPEGSVEPGGPAPKGQKPIVRAKNITNTPRPGAPAKDPTKMSIDRDVTFERQAYPGELIPDPKNPRQFIKAKGDEWVDIPTHQSAEVYARNFKEAALSKASPEMQAKYKDMPPEEFAKRYDQTVTYRLSPDAYGSGPKDLDTAVSNPGGTFSDPVGMGKTAEYKANEWYMRADLEAKTPAEREAFIADGMRQTTKQFGNQVEGRLEALNQNRGAGSANPDVAKVEPPPDLKLGVDTLRKVENHTMSPAEAEAELHRMGMSKESVAKDLGDFLARIYTMAVKP